MWGVSGAGVCSPGFLITHPKQELLPSQQWWEMSREHPGLQSLTLRTLDSSSWLCSVVLVMFFKEEGVTSGISMMLVIVNSSSDKVSFCLYLSDINDS